MDTNGLIAALDATAARSDDPISKAKIGTHIGNTGLNEPMTHCTNNLFPE